MKSPFWLKKIKQRLKYSRIDTREHEIDQIVTSYQAKTGLVLDLDNPQSFNEKLQWLKLYWRDPRLPILADKLAVRSYVEKTIGAEHLIPLIATYKAPGQIDISRFKEPVILKANHGSGWNLIIENSREHDNKTVIKLAKKWLSSNYYFAQREFQYKAIPPTILAEKLISDENGEIPSDYKFHIFTDRSGNKKLFIQMDSDRHSCHTRNFYTETWDRITLRLEYDNADQNAPRPKNLDNMLHLARQLSADFPYVRVDLYDTGSNIYFGEMTFTPGAGHEEFTPSQTNLDWGKLIDLSLYQHLIKS